MIKILKSIIVLVITFSITSCNPKFKVPDADKGDLDVSKFVAIGSSQTAGYADGALNYDSQQNSFANLLAQQFEEIGGVEFNTPYISESTNGVGVISGNTITVNGKSIMGTRIDCKGVSSLGPVKLISSENYTSFSNNIYNAGSPFQNMGVPNTKAIHVLYQGYGNNANPYFNPYYKRIASNPNTSSIISDAINQNPTFFSLQIGSEDVMAYALAGGASDTITSLSRFSAHIDSIIYYLTKNGAKGIISNIPSIHSLPYFNTITYNALSLDTAKARSLSQFYFPLDPSIKFYEGANAFIIEDQSTFLGLRQAVAGEYILLNVPLDDVKCNSMGSLIPIPDKYVLTLSEINAIENAIVNFNLILKNKAQSKGLAFVDMNAFYQKNKDNIVYNGITMNYIFVKGGIFSLDGLNLTNRGNALLANEYIKAINAQYKSTIKHLDATKYQGIIFP